VLKAPNHLPFKDNVLFTHTKTYAGRFNMAVCWMVVVIDSMQQPWMILWI
jgi:hypothetical protein